VSVNGDRVHAERVLSDALEAVEVPLPAVVTVSNELGEPRYPTLPQIMQAARKQVAVWTCSDLGLDPSEVGAAGARLELDALFIPEVDSECEFIEGDTPAEVASILAHRLREAKVI
jgi:electron transfer flavoprotein beta subunit